MIKERLLSFMGDMEGPETFSDHRELLSADVLMFPEQAALPKNPNTVYGHGWDESFTLPQSPVGVEDAQSPGVHATGFSVMFQDTTSHLPYSGQ